MTARSLPAGDGFHASQIRSGGNRKLGSCLGRNIQQSAVEAAVGPVEPARPIFAKSRIEGHRPVLIGARGSNSISSLGIV